MIKINPQQYHIAGTFLDDFDYHTVLKTMVAGITPGNIYVDQLNRPNLFFAQFRHRAFFNGDQDISEKFNLKQFLQDKVFSHCRETEVPLVRIAPGSKASFNFLNRQLTSLDPIIETYQIYQFDLSKTPGKALLTEGFDLQMVNRELISKEFNGKNDLMEEMCSERESVEAFLEHSFGIAAFLENTLAGWCLSEYNYQHRCEVGIATMVPFRQQGLAKAMTYEFLDLSTRHGINTVLWHCAKSNTASSKTALSAGFSLVVEEPVLIIYIDRGINLAVHGNICFENRDYQEAIEWYQKALSEENPQAWIPWNAACAAALLQKKDLAFDNLFKAVKLGFSDLDRLTQSKHLVQLRDDPRWGKVIVSLNQALYEKT